MKKLTDKQKLLTVALIGALLVIVLSATYAFFSYTRAGTTENTIKSGSITFLYDELNQEGNSIAITDAMPMTDTEGKAQDKYFNFKIVSKTGNTNSIPYDITVRKKDGSDNLDNYVKIYLAKIDNYNTTIANETEVALNTYNSLQDYSINNYTDKLVYRDIVPASSDSYTQFYRLKMWIDNSTPLSNETMNKTFTLTVNVYANGHILDANSGVATVNSLSVGGTELTVTSTENNIDYYETILPEGTTETTLSVNTGDYTNVHITKTHSDYSTPIAMNGEITRLSQTLSKRVSLTDGNNYFKIVATSEDGTDSKEIHARIVSGAIPGLGSIILENNTVLEQAPTLTDTSNNTSDVSGLYAMNVTNGFGGADGTTYYFRGNVTNNYVSFAGNIWRIVRINEDGTVRIILNDRIAGKGIAFNSNSQSTEYMYYSNSEIKNNLNTWYADSITGEDANKVATGSYFCELAKVTGISSNPPAANAYSDLYNSNSYTIDLSCQAYYCDNVEVSKSSYNNCTGTAEVRTTDGNGYGLLDSSYKVGLLTIDEVVMAGGYYYKYNTNYYLYKSTYHWWTMSPNGFFRNVSYVWGVWDDVTNIKDNYGVHSSYSARPVINIKADVTATGTGTSSDPYVIQ